MKIRMLSVLCGALLLSGCVSSPDAYRANIASWIGAPELRLVQAWGGPTRTYETDGHRFLVYERTRIVPALGGVPGSMSLSCTTTFELVNGVVVNSRGAGNDCRA